MDEPKKRVLLVDDDEGAIEPLQLALTEHGYEVLIARDGVEGISRAERDSPDVIILDVVMPRRSGFGMLNQISKSALRSTPVIMLTGNDRPQQRAYAEERGVHAFLSKPVDIEDVVRRVDALFER